MPHRTEYAPRCDGSADPDLFHRADADSKRAAARICNRCELRNPCLELGMAPPDEDMWGTWGGIDAAGRRALRAADPDRWPVRALLPADYLGTRVDRYGAERFVPYGYQDEDDYRDDNGQARAQWGTKLGLERPPVDWSASSAEANADALMDRYPAERGEPALLGGELRYPADTKTGYALTDDGVTLYLVNDNEFAA